MKRTRLSWDQLFMGMAAMLGQRTSCLHYQIGCVFVDDLHRIVTVGYNGSPRGDVNCLEIGCAKLEVNPATGRAGRCRGAHSEINAIINCVHPERLRGSTLYVTHSPCHACMKALVQTGVRTILYQDEYLRLAPSGEQEREDDAWELAERMGLGVYRHRPDTDTRVAVTPGGGDQCT